MRRSFLNLGFLVVGLFVLVQTATLAHASQHGDEKHEHDGVSCEICVTIHDKIIALPVNGFELEASVYALSILEPKTLSLEWFWPPERAPPPRGPPSFNL